MIIKLSNLHNQTSVSKWNDWHDVSHKPLLAWRLYRDSSVVLFNSNARKTKRTTKGRPGAWRSGLRINLTQRPPMTLLATGETNITWSWFAESAKSTRNRSGGWWMLAKKRGGCGRWLELWITLLGWLHFLLALAAFTKGPLLDLWPASQFVRWILVHQIPTGGGLVFQSGTFVALLDVRF